jgi:hypothetical protein
MSYLIRRRKESSDLSSRTITARVPVPLADAVEGVAFSKGMTISDFIRGALQAATDLDSTTSRHAAVLYEIVKTRGLLVRIADVQLDAGEVEKMLALAEGEAEEYVRERLGKEAGERRDSLTL